MTCNVLQSRGLLSENEFEILARVFDRVRKRRSFLVSGFVLMPEHWHALLCPAAGDTLPRLMGALKIASSRALNKSRYTQGEFWQLRYFDHAVRTVKEYWDSMQYMHFNPLKQGLVKKPEEWPWSSFHSYGGPGPIRLHVDVLDLPADETARL